MDFPATSSPATARRARVSATATETARAATDLRERAKQSNEVQFTNRGDATSRTRNRPLTPAELQALVRPIGSAREGDPARRTEGGFVFNVMPGAYTTVGMLASAAASQQLHSRAAGLNLAPPLSAAAADAVARAVGPAAEPAPQHVPLRSPSHRYSALVSERNPYTPPPVDRSRGAHGGVDLTWYPSADSLAAADAAAEAANVDRTDAAAVGRAQARLLRGRAIAKTAAGGAKAVSSPAAGTSGVTVDARGARSFRDKFGNVLSDNELDIGESQRVVHSDGTVEYVPPGRTPRGVRGRSSLPNREQNDQIDVDDFRRVIAMRRLEDDAEALKTNANGRLLGEHGEAGGPVKSLYGVSREERESRREERKRIKAAQFRFRIEKGRKSLIEEAGGKYSPNAGIRAVSRAEAQAVFTHASEELLRRDGLLPPSADERDAEQLERDYDEELEDEWHNDMQLVPLTPEGELDLSGTAASQADPRAVTKRDMRRDRAIVEDYESHLQRVEMVESGELVEGDDGWNIHQAAQRVRENAPASARRSMDILTNLLKKDSMPETVTAGTNGMPVPRSAAEALAQAEAHAGLAPAPSAAVASASNHGSASSGSGASGSGAGAAAGGSSNGDDADADAGSSYFPAARAARMAKKQRALSGVARVAAVADASRSPLERSNEAILLTGVPHEASSAAAAAAAAAADAVTRAGGSSAHRDTLAAAAHITTTLGEADQRRQALAQVAQERLLHPGRVRSAAEVGLALEAMLGAPETQRMLSDAGAAQSAASGLSAPVEAAKATAVAAGRLREQAQRTAAVESAVASVAIRTMSLTQTLDGMRTDAAAPPKRSSRKDAAADVAPVAPAAVSPRLAELAKRYDALRAREAAAMRAEQERFMPLSKPSLGHAWTAKNKVVSKFDEANLEAASMMYRARAHRALTASLEEEDMLRRLGDKNLAALMPSPDAPLSGGDDDENLLEDAVMFERQLADAEAHLKNVVAAGARSAERKMERQAAGKSAARRTIEDLAAKNAEKVRRREALFNMPAADIVQNVPFKKGGGRR